MANAASRILGSRIDTGIVITKYDHSKGPIANFTIREAGHPIPDENSFTATQQALDLVSGLTAQAKAKARDPSSSRGTRFPPRPTRRRASRRSSGSPNGRTRPRATR